MVNTDTVYSLYASDISVIKRYGKQYRYTLLRSKRLRGHEVDDDKHKGIRGLVNDEKLANNVSRAKAKIFEYAMCNDFSHFITLTINGAKHDRTDLETYVKKLTQFIRNERKRIGQDISYILIPEKHKDSNWHLHGLINIPDTELKKNKHGYLDWQRYSDKFGYCSIGKIRNKQAVSKYITKYVTKEFGSTITKLNAKLYYCTKGLKKAETIIEGTTSGEAMPTDFDFENEYVKVKTITELEALRIIYSIIENNC